MIDKRWWARLKRAYSVVSDLGVSSLDRSQGRTVVGANHFFAAGVLLCVPWTVIIALADPPRSLAPALTQLAMTSMWIVCLELNRRRRHAEAGSLGLAIMVAQYTYLPTVFSVWAGFQLPLIMAGLLVLVILPIGRWKLALLFVVLASASVARTFIDPALREPAVDVSETWLRAVAVGNVCMAALTMVVLGLFNHHFFMQERRRADALLAEAEVAARTDSLTELYNRRGIAPVLAEAARSGQYAVALADLDRFKRINDRLGHGAGDVVLANVARTMADAVGRLGSVARWGGEEFLVVLPGMTEAQAASAMERVRRAVEEEYGSSGILEHVTMSVGVAHAPRYTGKEEVLRLADAKLYEAKADGRNRVRSDSIDAPAVH